MQPERDSSAGPVQPTPSAALRFRPARWADITAGLFSMRRAVNARFSIPDGYRRLEEAGNFHNLRLAAGTTTGQYVNDLPFLDSDLYKWLEAVGWAADAAPDLSEELDHVVDLLRSAQDPDGYLQSYFQFHGDRFTDLEWGHELYCAGHLIQAAVAHVRTTGRTDLLDIARRVADHVDERFGPGRTEAVDGHPEIETALVELYRCTGQRRYLELAQVFVDRRGHGLLKGSRFGGQYTQDHVPVREAQAVAGHAVRQLYLLAGVADVAAETGEQVLLDAAERLWEEMVATKTYLTGGVGAHHTDEAFGDQYELPNERAYCETCAAIASVMFSFRLLLATGRARYADLIERTLYNGVLAGVSLSGDRYLYVNPLQVRDGHHLDHGDHTVFRTEWFHCACCPPNVMRLFASLEHYVAADDGTGLVLHQFVPGEYVAETGLGVRVDTSFPWDGDIDVTIAESPEQPRTLTLRIPHWTRTFELSVAGETVEVPVEDGWVRVTRNWHVGETLRLRIEMEPRLTAADPRVDTARGCVAIERGPLVYCVEKTDQDAVERLDDLVLDTAQPMTAEQRPELLGGVVVVRASGRRRRRPSGDSWWPYHEPEDVATEDETMPVLSIPYFAWGNRERSAMRVWNPVF